MATRTWNGGHASNNNWTEADNWGGTAPVAGDDLVFTGTTRLSPNNNFAADTSFNSITFSAGAGAFTLGGNRIKIVVSITNNDDSLQTIDLAVILMDRVDVYTTNGNITINGVISGAYGIDHRGTYTLTLTADNTFTAYIWTLEGTLSVAKITNKGVACPLGAQVNDYDGAIWLGSGATAGALKYTGTGHTHNRPVDAYGTTGSAIIEHAGTGLLKFTNYVDVSSTIGVKVLELKGSTAGTGEISGEIKDTAASLGVLKTGTNTWTLSGANTYDGTTTVSVGKLIVTGSISASSAVSVSSGATLAGNGTAAGTVNIANDGIIEPGVSSEATLNTGALTLNGTSVLTYGLGTTSDKIAVTGALVLDGTINVTAVSGFKPIRYLILTYTGALTNNTLAVGTMPSGYYATVSASGGNVYLLVSAGEQHSTNRGIRRGVGRGVA